VLWSKRKLFSFSTMRFTQHEILAILRQRGYKLTPQRRAVLKTIALSQNHLSPAEVYASVRQEYPSIGLVTIYRTLQIFTQLGLICEVHTGGRCRTYVMRRPSGHHHHLICSNCGGVTDFTDCDLGELEQRVSRETEFEIDGHLLQFFGHCRNCQSKPI
jgi:Fur family ferric uptake transcriptional regulator